MSGFKRSPSKIWWANDDLQWRDNSSSPGSQDSGFSDTETSRTSDRTTTKSPKRPPRNPPIQRIPNDLFKDASSEDHKQNLRRAKRKPPPRGRRKRRPALNLLERIDTLKNSPKVSRSLFNARQKEYKVALEPNQYSKEILQATTFLDTGEEATADDSYSWRSDITEDTYQPITTKSLPLISDKRRLEKCNSSAPAVLESNRDDEGITSANNSLSSDCESELECLFNGPLESPKHTSTPKGGKMRHRRDKLPLNLLLKYHNERVPPIEVNAVETENKAVQRWLDEAGQTYEQECMTTLQCKSIAGELNQKVSQLAACATTIIRGILSHSRCIEMEYRKLNSETRHVEPLIQSLAGNIIDFLKTHTREISSKILKLCDDIRLSKPEDSLRLVSLLYAPWETIREDILAREVKKMVDKLEDPTSELDLRATVTGITSIALRNEELIELFTKADIIPILLILCEKCEGSSLRSLILRALSTMCCNATAVRQFEKFSGVQIVADTLDDNSRPEPERSEAVALLAQVTAPWLEDNHSVKGLQDYSKKLVKSLTKFASTTKCCQNLLLCAAALANLSTMDPKSIKHMIHIKTAKVLIETVKNRGPRASIYLLEQVATLLANLSSLEPARKQLTGCEAPTVLLCFLKVNHGGEDVERRLQQKSIIALSRLCGEKEAAEQVVEYGGVEKLVKMCRERSERYDSDAVLVAALFFTTLRKIADACSINVLSAQDAQELVEPKLLDSFLAYSSQNESYV
ncbi:hypothetical protein NQ317_005256 [Molorchus minor]|uniref:Protein inscuteable homologue C-terminal domain-containing protein n=1 Tax=Molorchus minor TaxID=1323400 RepID=A0ABQ9JX82_9CUCU|nr:hypothetical protein NQ317_005256 [Molorchus minor]